MESGTKKRSVRQYLSKTDLDSILQNIETHKNREIIIELSAPKMPRNERNRIEKEGGIKLKNSMIKIFGKEKYHKILTLAIERNEKETALKEILKKAKNEIKKVEKRIDAFIFEVIERDNTEMIQKLEKSLTKINNETKRNEINTLISQTKETMAKQHNSIIQVFYTLAKDEKEREGRNRRQREYRERIKNKK
jgi:uncharacterized protein YdiU (UPF0061 family)